MKILVTGAAGFICSKLSYELCNLGYKPKVKMRDGVVKFITWFKEYKKG